MAVHFSFNSDIATAATIPARLYNDSVYLDLEQDRYYSPQHVPLRPVQPGGAERVYERGRYSVKRENGVLHFHALLHEFLQ